MKDLQKVENPITFHPASSHMYMTVCRKRKELVAKEVDI